MKSRKAYSKEFKLDAITLVRGGNKSKATQRSCLTI